MQCFNACLIRHNVSSFEIVYTYCDLLLGIYLFLFASHLLLWPRVVRPRDPRNPRNLRAISQTFGFVRAMAESSSSKCTNVDDVRIISDNPDVITMVDVLKEEQELEDCTKALLGASDDKNCTYVKGYLKRQAVYACITCTPNWKENLQPGGVCLACSYHCHEGHEIIELYTKRNFRCDCGNKKFPDNKCNLESNKDDLNEKNNYNQNFRGMYCTCKRPYPDPEDDTNDAMIQCVICEDWYHEKHLGMPTPVQVDNGDLVCGECMKKHEFLSFYALPESVSPSGKQCVLEGLECSEPVDLKHAVVFQTDWRLKLCKCETCLTQYETHGLNFLLDDQDTVQAYEEKGKACGESQYERGMKAFSSMDRVQRVEVIEGYNDMKSQLMEYLQKFVESKKIVREEDIREFFSGMEARKKQRVDVPHVPYFCR